MFDLSADIANKLNNDANFNITDGMSMFSPDA